MAEAEPTYEVSKLRKWLVDVEKRIGLTYWDLLKLSYFNDFPFGTLERLQDQAELYNRLASSQTFSATESFQLLLRRLALLGRDGQSCIELLRDPKYELSQPESNPELEQKLSRGSQLMEAIVAALVELSPEQRRRLLIRLGGRQLHWHRDFCTLFRVMSQLRHRLIIITERTEVFVEALQYVRAPRAAVERLVLYHNRYSLDLECFDFWAQQPVTDPGDTPRPASVPTITINESQSPSLNCLQRILGAITVTWEAVTGRREAQAQAMSGREVVTVMEAERRREEAEMGKREAERGRREAEERAESLRRQEEEEHELLPPILHRASDAPIVTQDPQFPGITFLGTPWKETVTSEGQEISWDSIGVAFSIPPGAVPEDKEVQLIVHPCLCGPFEPPDEHHLTGPSYHISHSCEFIPAIEISMNLHHSVHLRSDDDCKRMTFLSAPSRPTHEQDKPQYKFKVLRGGVFSRSKRYGTIKLQHFCFVGTGIFGRKPPDIYSARLYNNSPDPGGPCTRAAFCVVPYHRLYTTHVNSYMNEKEPEMKAGAGYIEEPVEFATSTNSEPAVTLELPTETPGYTIIPERQPLVISKRQVDSKSEIESYPKKLTLNIRPEGNNATPSSEPWHLNVLGFTQDLSFNVFPPLRGAHASLNEATVSASSQPVSSGVHGVQASLNGATVSASSQPVSSGVHEQQRASHHPEDRDLTSEDFAVFNDHPPELHELCDAAVEIVDLYDEIGMGLGLTRGHLRTIRANTAGRPNQVQLCLSEVFSHWRNDTKLPYTWETFASVLLQPRLRLETRLLLKNLHEHLTGKYSH